MRHDDTTLPIVTLLTREERWTRAEERWTRQHRRFARGRATASAEPTLDAIPTAVAYKDLTQREREHRARTATPGALAALPLDARLPSVYEAEDHPWGTDLSRAPGAAARERPGLDRLRARGHGDGPEPARRRRLHHRGCRAGLLILPVRGGSEGVGRGGAARLPRPRRGIARVVA